jgi:MtaA/CmuA family methyltransferase
MARCVETAIAFARAQVDAGADTIGIGDAVASQVSPGLYAALILPEERKLVSAIRAMGVYVRLHICGNITHLLPGIATLGVNILDVDHAVNLETVRRAVGPEVTLAGNVDPVACVMRGSPETIRAAIVACANAAGGRYMVNAGCEVPSATPPVNLHALCRPLTPGPPT